MNNSTMHLDRTVFQTVDADGTVISTTYGAKLSDDMTAVFSDQVDSLQELLALDAKGLIEFISEYNEDASQMIGRASDLDIPLFVNGLLFENHAKDASAEDDADHSPLRDAIKLEVDRVVKEYFANMQVPDLQSGLSLPATNPRKLKQSKPLQAKRQNSLA